MRASIMTGYSYNEIREFWTKQAQLHGKSYAASWSDQYAIELEIRTILDWLDDGDKVLDVGCANGFSTLEFAANKNIEIKGLDYIPEMIQNAKNNLVDFEGKLKGRACFDVGDITQLTEMENSFDKVVVIRVVINLFNWETQKIGLRELHRMVKPGGLLLLSEATLQGWQNMNHFRNEWGLDDIPMPSFNHYLDQDMVIEAMKPEMELIKLDNFSSSYYVGTRIIKVLLSQALNGKVNPANPDMDWNKWFSQLPAAGDFGTQKLFVFKKMG
jgi:ubiquinone/menaquinone biosynthesis C-methylase UbiE